jgi:hypothetical protein
MAYEWLRTMDTSLIKHDTVPLMGGAPSFPWKECITMLGQTLQCSDFSLEASELSWRNGDELFAGLGDDVQALGITISPFQEKAYWVMPSQDIATLMSLLITDAPKAASVTDKEVMKGFYTFIASEVLFTLDRLRHFKGTAPRISTEASLPTTDSLTLDVAITLKGSSTWGRFFLPKALHKEWIHHFASQPRMAQYPQELLDAINITVGAYAGAATLSYNEWANVQPGDVLLLDSCSIDVAKKEGPITLAANGHHIFKGTLTADGVIIGEGDAPAYAPSETPEEAPPAQDIEEETEDIEEETQEEKEAEEEEDDFDFDEDFDFENDDDFDFDED